MSTVGRQIGPIPISTLINLWIQIYLIPIAIFPYAGFIAFYWLASSNYVLVTSSYDNQENIHKHQYYSNIYEIDMIESYLVSIICFFFAHIHWSISHILSWISDIYIYTVHIFTYDDDKINT